MLSVKRPLRIRKRPTLNRYWRNIAPLLHAAPPPKGLSAAKREFYWRLVLQAKNIPHSVVSSRRSYCLYVPALRSGTALYEITAFEHERPPAPLCQPPGFSGEYRYLVFFLVLILWHWLRWEAGPLAGLPQTPESWLTLAGLDVYKTVRLGQWWRCVTALTLHADAAHVLSNAALGCVFGIPLSRRVGVGLAVLMPLLCGAAGNAATALLRPPGTVSQGFSTAVFAGIGLLAAYMAVYGYLHTLRQIKDIQGDGPSLPGTHLALRQAVIQGVLPLGAGLAFLALLGGSNAPNVDYLAHSMGLLCGMVAGLALSKIAIQQIQPGRPHAGLLQGGAAALTAGLLALCWGFALRG